MTEFIHKKTGSIYEKQYTAIFKRNVNNEPPKDGEHMVVYRDDQRRHYVRSQRDFEDGTFIERVQPQSAMVARLQSRIDTAEYQGRNWRRLCKSAVLLNVCFIMAIIWIWAADHIHLAAAK